MGNQYQTSIPPRLNYTTLLFHQTNNTKLESMMGFNISIHNNAIDYLYE